MAISVSAFGWHPGSVSYDYEILNIREYSFTEGRATIADPVGGGVLNLTFLATGNGGAVVGDRVKFNLVVDGTEKLIQHGFITDIELVYDPIQAMDTYRVTVADALSLAMSAAVGAGQSEASTDTTFQAYNTLVYGYIPRATPTAGKSNASAWTSPINVGDRVQQLLNTEQGGWDIDSSAQLKLSPRNINAAIIDGFSTASADYTTTYWRTTDWAAGTFSRTFYNRVLVEPEGLAVQEADTGGTVPRSTLNLKTADATTTQAKNLADYLLATLKSDGQSIIEVGCSLDQNMDTYSSVHKGKKLAELTPKTRPILRNKFRGTTSYALLLGRSISGTVGQVTRFRFQFAPQNAVSWLVLDDAVLGRLDYNKLGF